MKPQDVALWIGLASSIGGVAVGYGTLNEKVATLEKSTDATHLESRLTKLETRIEDNDIGHIGKEIQQVRGTVENLSEKVSGISVPDTGKIESRLSVLETQVGSVKARLEDTNDQLDKLRSGNKPLL